MATTLQYSGQYYRRQPKEGVEMQQLWKVMDDVQVAKSIAEQALSGSSTISGTFVQSVTGLNTDNTDPQNPIVQISVDGVTITGDGTPGNPLVGTPSSDSLSPLLLMGG